MSTEQKFEDAIPRGEAKTMLLRDLRGHASWLQLKGYDHFSKQVTWAANIIEGLK